MGKNLLNKEAYYEELLKINTKGRVDYFEDDDHHPYEATNYEVLELLKDSNLIQDKDIIVDYGSGKGRVACFLAKLLNIQVKGIEFNEELYDIAINNALHDERITFYLMDALDYQPVNENIYFFFHPFPIHILRKVVQNIIDSYYQNPRKCYIIVYYPSSEYMDYLLHLDALCLIEMIDCRKVLNSDDYRECLTVFEID